MESLETGSLIILIVYIILSAYATIKLGVLIHNHLSTITTIIATILISGSLVYVHLFILPSLGIILFIRLLFKTKSKRFKRVFVKKKSNNIYLRTKKGTLKIANIFRGVMITGGAGSGKSVSIFYPLISQLIKKDFSGILYDFKSPELSEFANSIFSEKNITKFHFLDFKNINHSVRVNPLSPKYLTKQSIASELATTLINNLLPESIKSKDYWTRSCISVVAGSIWYLKKNHPRMSTLPHLIAIIISFPSALLIEKLSSDRETAGMIASLKEAHEMKAEKQIAGVVGTLKNAIAQLNLPEIFYLLSEEDVDLDLNNINDPKFLAIGNDSSLSSTYAPVISLIISVCVNVMNQPKKHKSAIILDEGPTLFIPNFEQIPATARSNKVATIFGLQDFSQLIDRYGNDKAQVFLSNLGNQFYGRTINQKSASMINNLFGKHDVKYKSKSKSSGMSGEVLAGMDKNSRNKSSSESYQQRDKLSISEITNMSTGKFSGLIAEGNIDEFINVQFKAKKTTSKKFENKKNANDLKVFEKIYSEVESLMITTKKTREININLK